MGVNIGRMMANRAYLSPDLEAFIGDGYRYTYKEANERINQFVHFLKEQAFFPGDRLAILCRNNEHVVTAMFAAAKADGITVPLNWRLQAAELTYILNNSGTSVLLYDEEFAEVVNAMRPDIMVRKYIVVGKSHIDISYSEIMKGRPVDEPEPASCDEDTAVIMYTSGTTGKPKGAMLTHNNMFFVTDGHSCSIRWNSHYRFLSVAPLFHIGGLAPMFTNVLNGCTTVFLPEFNPLNVWKAVEEHKINFMMTVPLMLTFMKNVPDIDKMDLSSLDHIVCGGSMVPGSLIRAYKDMNIEVENVYGITEYAGAVTFWAHDMGMEKYESVGKMVYHGDIKIIDPETGKQLPPGEIGEICIKGPQVFKGYWDNPKATAQVLIDGWYHSGDMGKVDEDGFIYVVDRLKDMIVSGGENIYPAELEEVIAKHPGVAEVAVVGIPDEKWGEVPRAFVAKVPGVDLTEDDIFAICRENLAKFKMIKDVVFIDYLPRNGVAKVMKTELRKYPLK